MLNFSNFIQDSEVSDALKPHLQQLNMNSSMAEVHGLFTGIICFEKDTAIHWIDILDSDIDKQNILAKESIEILDAFYQMIKSSLYANDFDFQIAVLENEPFEIRLADFSLWVQSFLYGFGLNSTENNQNNTDNLSNLPSQIQEIINDFVNISRAEEYQISADEEDEQSLFELIEYVRMGVIHIADELKHLKEQDELKEFNKTSMKENTQLGHSISKLFH